MSMGKLGRSMEGSAQVIPSRQESWLEKLLFMLW